MTYDQARLLAVKLRQIANKIAGDRYIGSSFNSTFQSRAVEEDLNQALEPVGLELVHKEVKT